MGRRHRIRGNHNVLNVSTRGAAGLNPRGCVKQKGHTAKDVLRFFKQIDASVPRGLAVHVVLDNLSAHKAPEITTWLSHRDRRRWHLHFTPTSSSWTNLIEH